VQCDRSGRHLRQGLAVDDDGHGFWHDEPTGITHAFAVDAHAPGEDEGNRFRSRGEAQLGEGARERHLAGSPDETRTAARRGHDR
jgi:hypothetical protein